MTNVAIVFHSGFGHTRVQAEAVRDGAASVPDTTVHLIPVEEYEQRWREIDDADAIVFGAPTYMAGSSAPFKAFLEHDLEGIHDLGKRGIFEVAFATHAGMTDEAFDQTARVWLARAEHPKLGRLFKRCTYRPQIELLDYLRANGFKTYIVSGGGLDFMRPWAEKVYGIPPEQVIGSSGALQWGMKNGKPALLKMPSLVLNNDKEGKPVGIQRHIGRRPIAAFGNSDGDLQMLQWTCSAPGARLCLFVHHTDARREWAYDRGSHIGALDKGLDEAAARGWTVVDMKGDWARIFPFE